MADFGPKPWTNPFGKIFIFRLLELFFVYCLERLFFALEYHKTHFPGHYCLTIKNGRMADFGPKPWTNPFGKISIFRLLELFFFYCLERLFFALEYHKTHFPGHYCLTIKNGRISDFGPKPWKNLNFSTF